MEQKRAWPRLQIQKDRIIARTKRHMICWMQDFSLMTFKDSKKKRITIEDPETGIKIVERYKLVDVYGDINYSKDASGIRIYCPVKLERITARSNEFDAYPGTLVRC